MFMGGNYVYRSSLPSIYPANEKKKNQSRLTTSLIKNMHILQSHTSHIHQKSPCHTHILRLGNIGGVGGHVLGLLVVVGLLGILLLASLLVLLLFRLLVLVLLDGCFGDELFKDEVVALFLG